MKLVIEIPEGFYNLCQEKELLSAHHHNKVIIWDAVADGTPLPKGYGRLIDADVMIKRIINLPKCLNGYSKVYDEAMIINMINNELTIIEADKEQENGNVD